jgi:hypothetical protein
VSRGVGIAAFVPAVAVVAFLLFAPWTWIKAAPADVNERLEANPTTSALSLAREWNTPEAVGALMKAGARP